MNWLKCPLGCMQCAMCMHACKSCLWWTSIDGTSHLHISHHQHIDVWTTKWFFFLCMYDDVCTTKSDVQHRIIKWFRLRYDIEAKSWSNQIKMSWNVSNCNESGWVVAINRLQRNITKVKWIWRWAANVDGIVAACCKNENHNSSWTADNPFVVVLFSDKSIDLFRLLFNYACLIK